MNNKTHRVHTQTIQIFLFAGTGMMIVYRAQTKPYYSQFEPVSLSAQNLGFLQQNGQTDRSYCKLQLL